MGQELKAIQTLAQEIIVNINRVLDKRRIPCVKKGRIVKIDNHNYTVEIEGQQFTISSKLVFNLNETVGILTASDLVGDKYLLG